ncbi:MAG: DUF2267 domain-containing protein [Hyphomicrobiales bacterium]|nr:DUF2267 domain-containing protein [Hyphomicrobiales bacterium]MDE2017879.1 DUF2267 domain-containing protein [Hyphomicrobiales bacterium]
MPELIDRVAKAAGIAPDVSRQAIGTIVNFLRREGPPGEVDKLLAASPSLAAIAASTQAGGGEEGLPSALKGLGGFGGGGGLMALAGDLGGLGLDMGQMQAVGKELFAFGRDKAGEDVMGEIAGAIPGLGAMI